MPQPTNQVWIEEESKALETSESTIESSAKEDSTTESDETTSRFSTKQEVLNQLKTLTQDAENVNKQELDNLKQAFYKIHNQELSEAKKEVPAEEESTSETVAAVTIDPQEEEFKHLMSVIREKRNEQTAKAEREKEDNLQTKLAILEKLRELVESPEDANKSYHEFKKLQQQWNEIKLVPQAKVTELWKSYQHYVEKFYDLLKLNNEFREYDFKKNLEIKQHLC